MRATTWVAAMSAALTIATGAKAQETTLDFSGVDRFWTLVDSLAAETPPGDATWEAVFETAGYRYLVEVEGKGPLFRRAWPLVFQPSRAADLEAALEEGDRDERYIRHYMAVRWERDSLEAFRARIAGADLVARARERAAAFLPPGTTDGVPLPKITFAVFEPDGKASKGIVVVDLLLARWMGEDALAGFLGHELHHHYVGTISRLTPPDTDHPDRDLVRAVNQLRLEGVADLIDKRTMVEGPPDSTNAYAIRYRGLVETAPGRLAVVDSLVRGIVDDPEVAADYGAAVREALPLGGHPDGFYLARAVLQRHGRERMVAAMDDPFEFLALYQEAARADPRLFAFSAATMSWMERLRERYVTPVE